MSASSTLIAALAVPRLGADREVNLAEIDTLTREAARQGANLVRFPETALTGFAHRNEPQYDYQLAVLIPSVETDKLAQLACDCALYLAVGVLERDGTEMYDTALLFDPNGHIILKYRRISPQWHTRAADPVVYRQGATLPLAHTPFGDVAFLICGDITHEFLRRQVRDLKPSLLLFPLARGFDDDVHTEREWYEQEMGFYADHAADMGVSTLLVNYVGDVDGYIGGAVAYRTNGSIIASRPLHQPGLLLVELRVTQ